MTTFLQGETAIAAGGAADAPLAPAAVLQPAAGAPHPARPTLFLETLLATRLELLSRERAWPPQTLAQRQAVLLGLWGNRPDGLFEQHGTADGISQCLREAFAFAEEGKKAQAAMALKRAYFLVCCTVSAGTRARAHTGAPSGGHGQA
ncbi:hypothetical protein CTP10_R05760 [Cupriavidus sp. P-10]|uniref:hypothetical protein n=1 Tax=unclassified Cupriavidus TaxID=2640874 RepID=UPI000E2F1B9D|nr:MULTISPECIES: hypothetical protein [unclassified Cupriavidus]BDB23247.1 hypothetical protein CTP10_R05760 [Cupriavidus sp. P-10]